MHLGRIDRLVTFENVSADAAVFGRWQKLTRHISHRGRPRQGLIACGLVCGTLLASLAG